LGLQTVQCRTALLRIRRRPGLISQWQSIISNQPDWVEIVTWNDFNESSYLSPVDDPGKYFSELQTPRRYSHNGYCAFETLHHLV